MTLNLIILKDFNAGKLLDEFSKIQYFIQKLFKVSSIPELLEKVTVQNTFICGKSIFESNIIGILRVIANSIEALLCLQKK